jgi:phenylpropionate dioxygenase-like ring-hydroxylating dioxygenase large terminal subunit
MQSVKPGEWINKTMGWSELDFNTINLRITTDRYTSREFAEREREAIWMKVWQVAGRVDELPNNGDWKEYRLFDQSYLIVRGSDGKIRGFVNACRHRGNVLCSDKKGHSEGRFTCPYHLWSYGLDGRLVGVARPDLVGPIDKSELGLLEVPVDGFAGFIFINPDPKAKPLADFLGKEVLELLAPYKLEEMTPVMNVREPLDCNWKVVMDAFSEAYHIVGVHPQLLSVIVPDVVKNRNGWFGDHAVAVAPFEVKMEEGFGPEDEVKGIMALPATFPGVAEVLPIFEKRVAHYRDANGALKFPKGVTGRTLLQKATRETLTLKGLDVSGLSDDQMSDNQGWFLFPNFMMTIRAGEAHVIMSVPHPDGDPNRCIWHVSSYMWLPAAVREQYRAPLTEVDVPGSFPYFEALQQDYEQMPRQQKGLRNHALKYLHLAQEEVNVARFHAVVDRYMEGRVKA